MTHTSQLHNKTGKAYLWRFWFIAIAAWVLQLFSSYALVEWHCARPQDFSGQTLKLAIAILTLFCLAVTVGNLLRAYRYYRFLLQHKSAQSRQLFMAAGGALLSGFLAVVIVVQGWPAVVLSACHSAGG